MILRSETDVIVDAFRATWRFAQVDTGAVTKQLVKELFPSHVSDDHGGQGGEIFQQEVRQVFSALKS